MSKVRRFIQVPWPLGTIKTKLGEQGVDVVQDLATLTVPAYGMIDAGGESWIVYHEKALESFSRLIEQLQVFKTPVPFSKFFLLHAMFMVVVDRLYGPVKTAVSDVQLDFPSKNFLQEYSQFEEIDADHNLALRQAMITLSIEFIFGIKGITLDHSPDIKQHFLRMALECQSVDKTKDFPGRDQFEAFLESFLESLANETFGAMKVDLVNALGGLLRQEVKGRKKSRKGRIIRASLKNKPLVRDSANRILKRIETHALPTIAHPPPSPYDQTLDLAPVLQATLSELDTLTQSANHSSDDIEVPRNIGPYLVLKELGEGSMGQVLLAQSPEDKKVAIKIIKRGGPRPDLATLWRFGRELDLALRLKHPNVVEGVDYGISEGTAYLVLEYLNGGSLDERLKKEGHLEEREALNILRQLASGLAHAWSQPKMYMHRDIKPANILFNGQGVAKLTDFGLAAGMSHDATRFTKSGSILGTPHYMAPEQFEEDQEEDIRTDLWALGVVGYQCLTGALPFMGATVLTLFKAIKDQEPNRWPELRQRLSPGTRSLLEKLLSKNMDGRLENPQQLVDAIDALDIMNTTDHKAEKLKWPLCLECQEEPSGRLFHFVLFKGRELRFGRNSSAPVDLCLRLLPGPEHREKTARISGEHGRIRHDGRSYYVVDRSSNGLFLNGQKLQKKVPASLSSGDQINIAEVLGLGVCLFPGAIALYRRKNHEQHAYIVLEDEMPLRSLACDLEGWPEISGTLIRQGEGLLFMVHDGIQSDEGESEPGTVIPLEIGTQLSTKWGQITVRNVDPALFKTGQ
ncbi:MAG: FHA domain-containing serine/threonine-protein kinase [Planctomycetota bacterium]|nr:FHA domain-containing serine/threonine-protein kinase [Planctomycetota bacterium]